MSVLNYRLQYLQMADIDYLSARLLINSGLLFSGMPKAAESIEKLMKLFLMLEAKISRGEEIEAKHLKKYGHNLVKLFHKLKTLVPAEFDHSWEQYLGKLQESYDNRYPDQWSTAMKWESSLEQFDTVYAYLRNSIVKNFPAEEAMQAKYFGGGILTAYNKELIENICKNGGLPPTEILALNNKSIDRFEIEQQ